MTQVLIQHPRSGEEYEIAVADFRQGKHYRDPKSGELISYHDAGFRIVSLPDGSPYEPPAHVSEAVRDSLAGPSAEAAKKD